MKNSTIYITKTYTINDIVKKYINMYLLLGYMLLSLAINTFMRTIKLQKIDECEINSEFVENRLEFETSKIIYYIVGTLMVLINYDNVKKFHTPLEKIIPIENFIFISYTFVSTTYLISDLTFGYVPSQCYNSESICVSIYTIIEIVYLMFHFMFIIFAFIFMMIYLCDFLGEIYNKHFANIKLEYSEEQQIPIDKIV
jgi:Na+-transporting methylmalonyl-CoA/oxaloacetate decarboxylase gamma subunit